MKGKYKPAADHPWRKPYKSRRTQGTSAQPDSYATFEPRAKWRGQNVYQRIMQVIPDSVGE